jgi:hypothetical protein
MPILHLNDPVYGAADIAAPLLIDLYASDAVQRLNHIYQGGITAFVKQERATTRLDHSVGVMLLLRRLGAGVVEQAAGLVHDVAHTAFSHVVDFVFPNREHVYHEEHREAMILNSDLPAILARHGLDWRTVTDAENFSLLEQPLPRLCADRLDYFLRDGVLDFATFSAPEARRFLDHLVVAEGEIVVENLDAARWLGEHFIELDDRCWCSVQEVGLYAVMAEALRAALEEGIITEADFAGTDAEVLDRLRRAGSAGVDRWLALLHRDVVVRRHPANYDLVALPKVRAVDPPVLTDRGIQPLSHLDPTFARRREAYVTSKQGTWKLAITRPAPSSS